MHAVVIFGLTFTVPQLQELQDKAPPLTVVLVNAKSQTRPQNADALAQHHLDGGGNTDAKQRAQSPLPAITKDTETTELQVAQKRVAELEREARLVLTKADKIKASELADRLEKLAIEARKHSAAHPQIHVTSSEKGMGIDELRAAVLADVRS